jgi:hypothetical protein
MAKDLAALTPDDFEPLVGGTFVLGGESALELELVEVKRLGTALREGGGFSLLFASAPGPFRRQAIYRVEHPALGVLELFVVPLGPKNNTNQYEVIFT